MTPSEIIRSGPAVVTGAGRGLGRSLARALPRILINNAAVYPKRDLLDLPAGAFQDTLAVNLGGVVSTTQAVLQHMIKDGVGRIVNVATFADLNPLPMSAEYSVSKGAARIYTRALIADIGDRFPDIVVGDWMPGMLATRMGIADGLDPDHREILGGSGLKRRIKALLTLSPAPRPRVIPAL